MGKISGYENIRRKGRIQGSFFYLISPFTFATGKDKPMGQSCLFLEYCKRADKLDMSF